MNKRIEGLRKALIKPNIEAVFIESPFNRRYISGFSGSSGYVYISKDRSVFLTDFRYIEQANSECHGFEVVDYMVDGLDRTLKKLMKKDGVTRLGIEEHHMNVRGYKYYQEVFEGVKFISIEGFIENLRMIKDADEIALIRKAAQIADAGYEHILPFIKAGVKEVDIAIELEFFMRRNGASALSFETIVASGLRSSLPHGVATNKVIESGDFVTMDFGCIYEGYCSDMTRTLVVGKASDRQKAVYNTVLQAQKLGLGAIKAGLTGAEVDTVARDYIYDQGYEGYFGHGLGHSLGLEVHENPRVSSRGIALLEANMLVTIEPGIYIPDFGGVRIEDLVVVTDDSYENLTVSSTELIEL